MNNKETVASQVKVKLEIIIGEHSQNPIILRNSNYIIGRGSEADIVLQNDGVSREHLEIIFESNSFFIKDLDSLNGTLINNSKLGLTPVELSNGDLITLGIYETLFVLKFISSNSIPSDVELDSDRILSETGGPWALQVSSQSRDIWIFNEIQPVLPKLQFDVLEYLYQQEGKVCTLQKIFENCWIDEHNLKKNEVIYEKGLNDESIQKVISRIRGKLKRVDPHLITTIPGVGYKLDNWRM